MISRHRPATPIFAVTSSGRTHSQLALVWGVQSAVVQRAAMTDAMIATSLNAAFNRRVVKQGDLVVITAGVPTGTPGRTNMIQVHVV